MHVDLSGIRHGAMVEQRSKVASVLEAGLCAVDPYDAVRRALTLDGDRLQLGGDRFDLSDFDRIFVIGFGKAGAPMARACEDILGPRLTGGRVHVKDGHGQDCTLVTVSEGCHPLPDERNLKAAEALCSLADEADARTLVLVLVSGGGSALLCLPSRHLSLADKLETTRLLLASGASIGEINAIRRHLSAVKGGQLARRLAPATVLSLILSDVVGDPLETIASGPTVPDPTSFDTAWDVVTRYGLEKSAPAAVIAHLSAGRDGTIPDTPKPGDNAFERVHHHLVANLPIALDAAVREAERLGFNVLPLSSFMEGEARQLARFFLSLGREIHSRSLPVSRPALVIAGGETTVTLTGDGRGGRNQEFALAAVAYGLGALPNAVVAGFATDGTDGPTDASGAIADTETIERATAAGLSPETHLANNDAYGFFAPLDDLFLIGPTGTNVCDLYVLALF